MEGLVTLLLGALFVVFLILVICYVLSAIGLYKIAVAKGFHDKAFLAWIPFGNLYLIGLMVVEIDFFGMVIPRLELVLPLASIGVSMVSGSLSMLGDIGPIISSLLGLVMFIFSLLVHAVLFGEFDWSLRWVWAFFANPIGYLVIGSKASKQN